MKNPFKQKQTEPIIDKQLEDVGIVLERDIRQLRELTVRNTADIAQLLVDMEMKKLSLGSMDFLARMNIEPMILHQKYNAKKVVLR